jgi:hypothetical protein
MGNPVDHADALERIEIAAAEPGGIDRLMAGDTNDAALVAGHLAACPPCMREMSSIRRSAALAAAVIREQPDAALRERTLDYVRAMGRPAAASDGRSTVLEGDGIPAREGVPSGAPVATRDGERTTAAPVALGSRRPPGAVTWAAALVATAIVAASVSFAVIGSDRDAQLARQADDLSVLARTTALALKVEAQPDAATVLLNSGDGSAEGTVLYAARSGDLVVVATGLPAPPEGSEWFGWVEHGGIRRPIGPMRHSGEIAAWAGPVDGLAGIKDARFGVSLVPVGSWSPSASPLLLGEP